MERWVRWSLIVVIAVIALAACNTTPPSPLDTAKAALTANDSAKAIAELEKVIASEPNSAAAHLMLAQAYYRAGRKEDAQKEFTTGFTLDKAAALPIVTQDAEELFVAANIHATLNQFDEALAGYEAVLKIAPTKAGAVTNIGVVYYQNGKLDDAITQFKKALEIDPKDAETHYLLGAAQVQKDNLPDAETEFNTALELKPDLAPAHIGLGNVYLLRQQYDKAAASLEKAANLQPDSPEALFALGQAYAALGRKDDAKTAMTKCLQLNPPEPFRSKAQEILTQLSAQ